MTTAWISWVPSCLGRLLLWQFRDPDLWQRGIVVQRLRPTTYIVQAANIILHVHVNHLSRAPEEEGNMQVTVAHPGPVPDRPTGLYAEARNPAHSLGPTSPEQLTCAQNFNTSSSSAVTSTRVGISRGFPILCMWCQTCLWHQPGSLQLSLHSRHHHYPSPAKPVELVPFRVHWLKFWFPFILPVHQIEKELSESCLLIFMANIWVLFIQGKGNVMSSLK